MNRTVSRAFIGAGVALILASCMSGGTRVDAAKVKAFQKGVTTEAEVIAALGKPNTVSASGSGRTLTYAWFHAQPKASSFIPFVGAFVGGADSRIEQVNFLFGNDGKLADIVTQQSENGVAMGISAGTQPSIEDQPKNAP